MSKTKKIYCTRCGSVLIPSVISLGGTGGSDFSDPYPYYNSKTGKMPFAIKYTCPKQKWYLFDLHDSKRGAVFWKKRAIK